MPGGILMADSILNNEFRDMSAQANYPFTTESSLVSVSAETLPTALILDALFYPVESRTAPFYLYSIKGPIQNESGLKFTINDDSFLPVGTCVCYTGTDTAMCRDSNGRIVGVLVYSPSEMSKLAGLVASKEIFFAKENAQFVAGVAFCPAVTGTIGIKAADSYFFGNVSIVAAGGLTWEAEPDSAYSLNLYGEMRTLKTPVKTINNISAEHLWISAYPGQSRSVEPDESSSSSEQIIDRGADLRVVTKQEGAVTSIVIGKPRDFQYGE
jgi:hypothetical protein